MRHFAVLAAGVMLAACGSGGGGGVGSLWSNPDQLVGRSFAAVASPGVLVNGTGNSTTYSDAITIRFTGANTADVTINGTTTPVTLTAAGEYEDAFGTLFLLADTSLAGNPLTPDILYLSVIDDIGVNGVITNFLVGGNQTALANLPVTGNTTYRGEVVMIDGAPNSGQGKIAITPDFATATINGRIVGGFPADLTAVFKFVPGTIVNGTFVTSLTSTDVSIFGSDIQGSFFGASGEQIGGTLRIDAFEGNAVGMFGAAR